MKKIVFPLLAAVAALILASCATEPMDAPDPAQGGEPVPVSFSLNLGDALTKAAPEASDFDNASGEFILYAAAFSKTTGALISTSKIGGPGFQPVATVSAKNISIVLTLSRSQDYKVVFFAMREGAFEVNFAGNNVATFSYKGSLWANDASLDAFCASIDVSSSIKRYDVTLKRPFAQLNVLAPIGNVPAGQTTFSSSMTVQAPASFNLYSGTAGTDLQELTFAGNAIAATPVGAYKTTHTWIGMNYVLVPASGNVTVSSFAESGMSEPVQIGVVPVRANCRTNIVGSIYSLSDFVFNVQIDSDFEDEQELSTEEGPNPILMRTDPGCYLSDHTRSYEAGYDQYVREYDGTALTFALLNPAEDEQLVLTGYANTMQVGDYVTIQLDWKKGTTRQLAGMYNMEVVAEEGRKVWIADDNGNGFVICK